MVSSQSGCASAPFRTPITRIPNERALAGDAAAKRTHADDAECATTQCRPMQRIPGSLMLTLINSGI